MKILYDPDNFSIKDHIMPQSIEKAQILRMDFHKLIKMKTRQNQSVPATA